MSVFTFFFNLQVTFEAINRKLRWFSVIFSQILAMTRTFNYLLLYYFLFRILLIFQPCCFPPAKMPNRLVIIQYVLDLICQLWINNGQPFRQILMNGAFRDTKFLCYHSHGFLRLHDMLSNLDCSLFDVIVHTTRLLRIYRHAK